MGSFLFCKTECIPQRTGIFSRDPATGTAERNQTRRPSRSWRGRWRCGRRESRRLSRHDRAMRMSNTKLRRTSTKQFVSSTNLRPPTTAIGQSMRDRARPRNARAPRASSFRKPTRSRAISTASRSLDAPSDALASSRSRGSSQNALRTLPARVARAPELVMRDRGDRRRVDDLRRRVDVGTCPRFRTPHRSISNVRQLAVGRDSSLS